jgi:pimeloyl-ACP methyl ester carboxylesterase
VAAAERPREVWLPAFAGSAHHIAGKRRIVMPFYEKGQVRIHYEEAGSGFPLFIIPGGGLNSNINKLSESHPFNPMVEFKGEYRCIAMDLRNADGGQSTGPLDVDRPWDMHAEDQIGLLDHLGVKNFLVMGFCIGNPLIWNLLKRIPERIVAAVSAQPSGFRPELPDHFYKTNSAKWGPALVKRNPQITPAMVDQFLRKMYLSNPDFVFSVTRDFVRNCKTPLLVMPDDSEAHPYPVAMEMVRLAPNAQVSLYPWKDSKENTRLAVRHARTFLKANRPAGV